MPCLRVAGALAVEIGRAAAVRIDQHGRDALREHRLAVLQLLGREPAARVRMDVDEARGRAPGRGIDRLGRPSRPSRRPTA